MYHIHDRKHIICPSKLKKKKGEKRQVKVSKQLRERARIFYLCVRERERERDRVDGTAQTASPRSFIF